MKDLFGNNITNHKKGIGSHESTKMKNDEWLTPPYIIKALGQFDLDPCSPSPNKRPWNTAKKHFSLEDNGLHQKWSGRVWLNPPYGNQTHRWMNKLKNHNNGIALIFARTETKTFHDHIWNNATAIFFFKGRIKFYTVNGKPDKAPAGAPSCIIAYGYDNFIAINNAIQNNLIQGKLILINYNP